MGAGRRLTDDEIERELARLPGWEIVDGKLHRELRCPRVPLQGRVRPVVVRVGREVQAVRRRL